jgi:hypothetical protein
MEGKVEEMDDGKREKEGRGVRIGRNNPLFPAI